MGCGPSHLQQAQMEEILTRVRALDGQALPHGAQAKATPSSAPAEPRVTCSPHGRWTVEHYEGDKNNKADFTLSEMTEGNDVLLSRLRGIRVVLPVGAKSVICVGCMDVDVVVQSAAALEITDSQHCAATVNGRLVACQVSRCDLTVVTLSRAAAGARVRTTASPMTTLCAAGDGLQGECTYQPPEAIYTTFEVAEGEAAFHSTLDVPV